MIVKLMLEVAGKPIALPDVHVVSSESFTMDEVVATTARTIREQVEAERNQVLEAYHQRIAMEFAKSSATYNIPSTPLPKVYREPDGTTIEFADGRQMVMHDSMFTELAEAYGITKWEEMK